MNGGFFRELNEELSAKKVDIRTYSPLSFAYIGDAVYDLMIRTYVLSFGNTDNRKLHEKTTRYVSARAQAKIADRLFGELTEEEQGIYKRGRNAKPHSGAKHATGCEYLKATGFETLIGYLYLKGETERIEKIVKAAIRVIEDTEGKVLTDGTGDENE
ncbi:MAG: ribonuclease III [Lachnospiraceae bacterium]|nr:ribonuclease III [Lachnospiraceae bacterium]